MFQGWFSRLPETVRIFKFFRKIPATPSKISNLKSTKKPVPNSKEKGGSSKQRPHSKTLAKGMQKSKRRGLFPIKSNFLSIPPKIIKSAN
jgi:hypothetical protein